MKVVLREEVPSLGRRGDVCDVADGYAQNYLIPRGLAIRATRGSARQSEAMRRSREIADAAALSEAREMAERLVGCNIRVVARASETGRLYGSVSAANLASAIAEQVRVVLAPEMLDLPEPIKQVGSYKIAAKPHPEVAAEVSLDVVAGE